MSQINWSSFNGDIFQSFCNDLLSFEIGKNFVPFSAPGGDQGIDGLFKGEYNGITGKWRFQAKFHHPDTGRVAGVNQIKKQIREDLGANIQDETTIVFITNVELNPNQRKELLGLANDKIRQENKKVQFDIWDGAKINTLLAHNPIVKLWYVNEAKYLIQEYSEFFQTELNSKTNTSYELSNKFYHRKEKLDDIEKFIQNDSKKVAVVSGEAGIGKTRLCIEFFRQYIDHDQSWLALVVITHQINLEVLQIALTGEKNYLVLIDDADKFEEGDIADLIAIVKGIKGNKVKLLLTVRSYFLNKVLSQITTNDLTERLESIELAKLTREETVQFLEGELNGYKIDKHLGYFVELTHGVPIVIMTLIKVIKSGTQLANIKKDSFLRIYVKQHFDHFTDAISKEREIDKKSINKVLILITLIEPIQIENINLIQQIAKTENVSEEDVTIILQTLKNQNIIAGRYQFAIKPDMYSDLILEEALNSKKWLESKLPKYGMYINNIIRNIGYVYQHEENNSVVEILLKGYIEQIDTCSNYQELTEILDTVYSITYSMPLLASETVDKVISIYSNQIHPLYGKFQESLKYKNYSLDSTINTLKSILQSLFQLEKYYVYAYSCSGQLFRLLNDDGVVSNIASFGRSDDFDGFSCKQQNRVLSESKKELNKSKEGMKLFALKTFKSLLKLGFTSVESHLFKKYSVQMYTLNIPENKYVKKLREDIIDLLFVFFRKELDKELKDETLRIIVEIPREIIAARNKTYKGKKEIKAVLDFLCSVSSKNILELKQKQFIKDQLYWFKRWGIDPSHHEIVDKINANLSENDLAETLLDLFNPKYEGEVIDERERYKTESQNLVKMYSGTDLGNALVKVIEQSEYTPHYFYLFFDTISSDLAKTKEIVDHLWGTNKAFVISYCSSLLRELRFSEKYDDFYWGYIQKLQNEGSVEAKNCMLQVYNSFMISDVYAKSDNKAVLQSEDVEHIVSVFKSCTIDNYFQLASTLPTLFFHDKKTAIQEIKFFLSVCNERQLNSLFLAIEPIAEKFYSEIKELLFKYTLHLNIPYTVERALNRIIKRDGFHEVLEYIENRFLYKRKDIIEKKSLLGYDYVPIHTGNAITSELSEDKKSEIFSDVLNWFVNFDFEPYEHFYANNIIELFATHKYIDHDSKDVYIKLIVKYNSDYRRLLNIIRSLSEFNQKDEAFVQLILKLLEVSFENLQGNDQLHKITSQCYILLTSLGVKSGTPGQPFSVDLELKELLENTLKSSKVNSPKIKDFFQKVLKSVQADIDSYKDEEGDELW